MPNSTNNTTPSNKWIKLSFFGLLLLTNLILFIPLPPASSQSLFKIPYLDKIVHFLLFFILTHFLLYYFFPPTKKNNYLKNHFIIYFILFLLYTTITEFIQIIIPNRHFSIYDLGANYLGILASYLVFYLRKTSLNQ